MAEIVPYTYEDFKEDISKRAFNEQGRVYQRLIELIEPFITEGLLYFYPRNVFNEETKKDFIFFYENHISVVEFEKDKFYKIRSVQTNIKNMTLTIPHYDHENLELKLELDSEEIELKSLLDSNRSWNPEFKATINEVHKLLIKCI